MPAANAPASIGIWARAHVNPLGYGVIGNTDDSGSFVLGSSPGTPARNELMLQTIAASFMVLATSATAIFQLAIVFGAPLGEYSYGGANKGKLPIGYRIGSVVSFGLMVAFAGHYLAQLGVFQPILDPAGNSVVNWVLVGSNGLAALANNATRSKKERMVWGIPTILMFLASLAVALQL